MEGLGMPEGFDEAVYLIEINNCVKDYLRKVMKPKVKFTTISGRAALNLEISTGIPIQIPENTPFDDIKQAKKEALLKFFAKRPWILLPNRESPIPRIIQILRALFHFSGQPFYITCEGDIQPAQ
ncbi:hypothetical protein TVAGG3_0248660 [Trichomonas vaginalis G3]|uniref:hypothetical protein n=1 Tax=Trichomonas vaginalis (strain ATCC PRA-98 / G3) TaxID=412133 RepID=UPI0021E52EF7|nr:hypothetical protein TVAGG3_0248660 [Trichomonas vaginalis G3]KAI5553832.1 hypothetical protein TVAGG3_0248660 [Trichomonas vaginalis G3]